MVDANYEKLIYLARITEQAERHEETIKYMEEIVKTKKEDLTVEERNLLSAAFKNCVSARRSAWRSIYGVEVKEKTNESKFLHLVTDLKTLLETELSDLCNQMLSLIDNYLVKKASSEESKVFYLKMKGDYYRYNSEFALGPDFDTAVNLADKAYKEAYEIANEYCKENFK